MAVLQEEYREYAQILSIHQSIDMQLKNSKKERVEVKCKLLEQYKAAIMAKKSKKIMERFEEIEGRLSNASSSFPSSLRKTSQRNEIIALNPEKRLIYGRVNEPSSQMLKSRNFRSE
jgi:hypothetical protein